MDCEFTAPSGKYRDRFFKKGKGNLPMIPLLLSFGRRRSVPLELCSKLDLHKPTLGLRYTSSSCYCCCFLKKYRPSNYYSSLCRRYTNIYYSSSGVPFYRRFPFDFNFAPEFSEYYGALSEYHSISSLHVAAKDAYLGSSVGRRRASLSSTHNNNNNNNKVSSRPYLIMVLWRRSITCGFSLTHASLASLHVVTKAARLAKGSNSMCRP